MQMSEGRVPLRVVIVDDHVISRAAVSALLRTEGVAVLADLDGPGASVQSICELGPDIVILDVSHGTPRGVDLARGFRDRRDGPRVVITACAECAAPAAGLEGLPFITKADVGLRALTRALADGRR